MYIKPSAPVGHTVTTQERKLLLLSLVKCWSLICKAVVVINKEIQMKDCANKLRALSLIRSLKILSGSALKPFRGPLLQKLCWQPVHGDFREKTQTLESASATMFIKYGDHLGENIQALPQSKWVITAVTFIWEEKFSQILCWNFQMETDSVKTLLPLGLDL